MTVFIIISIAIILVSIGLLLRPLLTERDSISYERQAQNIHFAKERLAELEEQLKNASISATDYEALKLEIENTLAEDIDMATQAEVKSDKPSTGSNRLAIAALCLGLPLAAFGVYMIIGNPASVTNEQASNTQNQAAPTSAQQNQVEALIRGIEQRLAEQPDDLEGWSLIARTYLSLGRYQDAQNAYLKVLALGGEKPSTYAALADATALLANGEITAEATMYINKALGMDQNNQQALWLAGLGALQRNDDAAAKDYWGNLLQQLSDMPEQQQELREIMAQSLGSAPAAPAVANNTNQTTTTQPKPSSNKSPALILEVSLSNELASKASPNDLVFVIARAKNGPPAPLAVKRLTVAQLPTTVTLTDADAMMAQFSLSAFPDVVVRARVSKSGQPVASAGDLQSAGIEVKNSHAESVSLTISDVID
ncbi:c-type cytochrome biogenesis protein CcmI [Arenicella xantha]|uniref:Cytochrome c-type biogenesis protein CcmH n=1 Tax=Arenicella xantha TaxID=644221 RepID=A0A395JIZ7_9GAMM|nr:c-type cytochrome biogenesis protein CcmI [Arenicella xantha]RBP48611.1 cytochrome c-type biogenesis protein CcmH [Arenicella xantha]